MAIRLAFVTALLVIMLSRAVRAFGTRAPTLIKSSPRSIGAFVARGMSTSEPDTSIVDTCQQKIQQALEADIVKVVGA